MKKLLIYIAFALLLSSCATAKYKVRNHQNKIAQEKIQYQRSLIAHDHSIATKVVQTKYKVRKHRNRIAQDEIQNTHSLSAHQDWTRAFRNWHNRPKGNWPFNFLQ